ncbi:MAG: long-chain fatty acid--CoA ligase [Hyphomicrobiaceae bacterium]|nr:long-chain fatty acid--CoA ligase [Hyphomicrobiaceae bacterium]
MAASANRSPTSASLPWLDHYPDGVNWHQEFEPRPLHSLIDDACRDFGPRPATNFLGKSLTYAEIGRLVDRAATGLQKLGVGKGTKVGLLLPNSPTFIVYYFAIAKVGATVVNYNPLYTVDELGHQIADSETEIMVTLDLKILFDKVDALLTTGQLPRAIVASFSALLPATKSVLFRLFRGRELARPYASSAASRIVADTEVLDNDGSFAPVAINAVCDVAVLQYTGGTTGVPKGAMLTHANVTINVQQSLAWVSGVVAGQERVLGALPFFHVFAMTAVMNFAIAIGAEIIIMPRFVLNDAMALITKMRPTLMPGVPTMFIAMLNHPKLESFDLSSLKFCLSGGAPLLLDTKQRFERLTGCKVVEAYGLSETSPGVTVNPINGPVKPLSIGQPLPGTIVSLRDPANPDIVMPPGEKGEICIKGPQVMKGYWKKPAETAQQTTSDGYLRTGDIAIMDDEGFLFIVDRTKDLIICSGYNVYPRNVEEAISKHPAVEEVTVIGIPDTYRGEAPKAFIKLRGGTSATEKDILAHLTPLLSRIEIPAEIEFRDQLPKTLIGKLSKKELKEEEARRRATK